MALSASAFDLELGRLIDDFEQKVSFKGSDFNVAFTMLDKFSKPIAGLQLSRHFILQRSDFTAIGEPVAGDIMTSGGETYLCLGVDRDPTDLELRCNMYLLPTSVVFKVATGFDSDGTGNESVASVGETLRARVDLIDDRGDIPSGELIQVRTFIIQKPTVTPLQGSVIEYAGETIKIRSIAEIRSNNGEIAAWRLAG